MLIQKLRLQRGWSQEQLAHLSGLSVRTIQRIENGQAPSVESLKSLASVFEMDFSELRENDMILADRTPAITPDEELALNQVREIKRFYLRIMQYAVVVAILAAINLTMDARYLWFLWVALFWGVALAFKGLRVFDKIPFLNAAWEKRQVERKLGRQL
ncbi:2TM domain-containing protein [uncultured Bosea sp.]|uniref:2TM domain-containing protein n=1 Tax=uncultured Bosea sp. TaxID=211457 RepID=UPI00263B256D|nr:2TM domain-containing protein [uncultured Bosea sp.]